MGPFSMALCMLLLPDLLGAQGALVAGIIAWMALWWILRPVEVYVTALLPIVLNAFFDVLPMHLVIGQYFSEVIVLLLGADLLCLTWTATKLDQRLSLKVLGLVGPSMKQQIIVWFFAAAILSLFFPKTVVCILMTNIAVSMFAFVGNADIKNNTSAVPILLAIAWGCGIGGAGSPLGGPMNLIAIDYMETHTGAEFMYIDWLTRMLPFTLIILGIALCYLLCIRLPAQHMTGTKEYFRHAYKSLEKISKGEKIALTLFLAATLLSFLRPLFADILPQMKPAYCFFALGTLAFFLRNDEAQPLLTWKYVEKKIMWGILFLFGGSLALGKMLIETGTADTIARLLAQSNFSHDIILIGVITLLTCAFAEISSSTAASAISVPVVMSLTLALQVNPAPYWYITIMAFNCAYILPLTVRAVPVGHGMDAGYLIKYGTPLALLSWLAITVVGYMFMRFWPQFSVI